MYKISLKLVFLLSVCFSSCCFSQNSDTNKGYLNFIVKKDLLYTCANIVTRDYVKWNYFGFTIEQMFKSNHSIQISTYGARFPSHAKGKWFVITPEYKYFVSKKKKYAGYYIGGGG